MPILSIPSYVTLVSLCLCLCIPVSLYARVYFMSVFIYIVIMYARFFTSVFIIPFLLYIRFYFGSPGHGYSGLWRHVVRPRGIQVRILNFYLSNFSLSNFNLSKPPFQPVGDVHIGGMWRSRGRRD